MDIHKLIEQIGSDPQLLAELLSKPNESDRKAILINRGMLKPTDAGPQKAQLEKEMISMISPTPTAPGVVPSNERVVEWVGAIATAAAGAAAAACSSDA